MGINNKDPNTKGIKMKKIQRIRLMSGIIIFLTIMNQIM